MAKTQEDILREMQANQEASLARGRERGVDLFGEGKLGRIDTGRSSDMSDIVSRLKQGSYGYSAPEAAARREQALRGINQQYATQMRQGRAQATQTGLRGAAAQAAAQRASQEAQRQQAIARQNLFVQGEDAARAGLQSYYQGLAAQEGAETGKQQFNIEQKNKELYGKLATEMGYGGLGAQNYATAGALGIQNQQMSNLNQQQQQAQKEARKQELLKEYIKSAATPRGKEILAELARLG